MNASDPYERFTRLLILHEPELLRCVLIAVPNRTDARDIMQECSVALWRHFSEYDPQRPFVNWAMGFARMEVRRFLRSAQRRAQLTEQAVELLFQTEQQHAQELEEREQHLNHCLQKLPQDQRRLLQRYYGQEESVGELSKSTGRTIDAIYKMLQRIRHALYLCVERKLREFEA